MGKSDDKTNVCRVLDQKKVSYKTHVCPDAEGLSGDEIAAVLMRIRNRLSRHLLQLARQVRIMYLLFLLIRNWI